MLTAALVFLFRNWISERIKNAIKHEYDEKLETHKAQLKYESDKEIEKLKAQLKITAAERIIRLSATYDKIADTIATTYAKLWAFQKAVEDYAQSSEHSDFTRTQEFQKNIQSCWEDVLRYFLPRKIYFSKGTAEKIIYFVNTLQTVSGAFGMYLASRGNPGSTEKNYQRFTEYSKEASELLAVLEEDFRGILGMEERKRAAL